MSEILDFMQRTEDNNAIVIQIYDMCANKKEYKKILNFCKKQLREFKSFNRKCKKDTKAHQIKILIIREGSLVVKSEIYNFIPEFCNSSDNPFEIKISITDSSKNGFTTYGSSVNKGCNEAEFIEFIKILNRGYYEFTKEF